MIDGNSAFQEEKPINLPFISQIIFTIIKLYLLPARCGRVSQLIRKQDNTNGQD